MKLKSNKILMHSFGLISNNFMSLTITILSILTYTSKFLMCTSHRFKQMSLQVAKPCWGTLQEPRWEKCFCRLSSLSYSSDWILQQCPVDRIVRLNYNKLFCSNEFLIGNISFEFKLDYKNSKYLLRKVPIFHLWIDQHFSSTMQWGWIPVGLINPILVIKS